MKLLVVTGSFPAVTQTFVTRQVMAAAVRHDVGVLASARGSVEGLQLPKAILDRSIFTDWRRSAPWPFQVAAWSARVKNAAAPETFGRLLGLRRRRYFAELLTRPYVRSVDLIHAHWTEPALSIALPLGRALGRPVTCTAHDSFLPNVPTAQLRALQQSLHAIVLVSRWSYDHWASRTGSEDRLVHIANGVDLGELSTGSGNDAPTIVNVARCDPQKRQRDLLQALAVLRASGVRARAVIVGNGVELERLRKLASDLGLAESVTFLGAVNHDVVLETLRRADIFVLPSEYESFGVATAEAMAAGLPVVVTRTTGCLDLVEDGKTGFLVPVGDPVVLASRLRELIEHPDRRRLMGMAGRRKAEREFSFAQHMQAMEKVWDQAANAGRSREVEYCAV